MKTRPLAILMSLFALFGCSTTRVLQEGEFRLARNEIKVLNDSRFSTGELSKYLKQQENFNILGWNPMEGIYNLSSPDGTKGRFFRIIGTEPVIYNHNLVEASARSITNHLEYTGYFGSEIATNVSLHKKNVTVRYNVELGKRYVIDTIIFKLPENEALREAFMADVPNVSVKAGDFLAEETLEYESQRSAAALKGMGFYTLTKSHYFFEADTLSRKGHALLTMEIREHTRNETEDFAKPLEIYNIGHVTISHDKNLVFKEKIFKELNTIKPGTVYNDKDINNTYSRLAGLNTFSSVSIETTPNEDGTVDCAIKVAQPKGKGVKANLEASTNSSGLIGISPQISFFNKNLFHGGEMLNLSFMGDFQFQFNNNTRANEFGISAGLSLPKFLGLPYRFFDGPTIPRTEFNLSFNYQDRPEYERSIYSASIGYTWNRRNHVFYQLYPLQMNTVKLRQIDESISEIWIKNPFLRYSYQDHLDLGMGGSVYYTTDASVNPAHSYGYIRLTADLSGNAINMFKNYLPENSEGFHTIGGIPYSQFVRGELNMARIIRLGRDNQNALALHFVGGIGHAYGNSTAMPFEKQFYCGGANSMRGWQARTLGPGASMDVMPFDIPSQTGDLKLEGDIEYRFRLISNLEGALFYEMGNVWTVQDVSDLDATKASKLADSIAMDWGTGLRLNMDFLVIRVDAGFKVKDPQTVDKWVSPAKWLKRDGFAFHFGVGYPF